MHKPKQDSSRHTINKHQKTNNTLKYMTKNKETLLTHMIEDLRATVPVNAEAPAENIVIPGDVEEVRKKKNTESKRKGECTEKRTKVMPTMNDDLRATVIVIELQI